MADFRSIFISDLHLGSRGCKAEAILKFLRENTCENLYLVGDVMDFWALDRRGYFPDSHRAVVHHLMQQTDWGMRIVYLVGNHDEALRPFLPIDLMNIEIRDDIVHETADGRRYLVIHGDRFDDVMEKARWLAYIGDVAYTWLLRSNGAVNRLRARFGLAPWSLSAWMKKRVKAACTFISNFETSLAEAARDRGCEGVICGHIHTAEDRRIDGVHYLNTGDWVESLTALVEHHDGYLEVIGCPDGTCKPMHLDVSFDKPVRIAA